MKRFFILTVLIPVLAFALNSCGGEQAKTDYDVIIIGSGGGGMAAGARLCLAGKKVLIIERNDKTGGYMTNFKKGDYIFEVSLHALDGYNEGWFNRKVFENLGIKDKVKPIHIKPVMYRALYPDFSVEVPTDINEYIALLKKMFPQEVDGIDRLFNTLDKIQTAMDCTMYFSNQEYGKGLWASIIHVNTFFTLAKYWNSTLTEFLADYIKDEKLVSMITQLTGLLGDGPDKISGIVFAAALNQYHKGGYYYFDGQGEGGGAHAIIKSLEEVIRANGGTILLKTNVTKIVIKDGKAEGVQTADGKIYTSKFVISNSDARNTVYNLIGKEHFSEKYLAKLEKMRPGITCFVVYMGVKHDYTGLYPKGSHNILQNVSNNAIESYNYIREGNVDNMPFALLDFSCIDKVAPAGKNVLNLTTVMPYDWHNGWEYNDKAKYEALKKEVAMKLIKRAEKILPGLSKNIEVMEIFTPRTLEAWTGNYKGAILGWDNDNDQVMLNRLPQETAIPNVLLAGAWTFPSGGQSTVLVSGMMAADKILGKL